MPVYLEITPAFTSYGGGFAENTLLVGRSLPDRSLQ